jgi:hypothetical protein
MKWVAITTVFFSAFAKFMFAPLIGKGFQLDFITSWVSSFAGGLVSAIIFYFLSEYFMKRYHKKKVEKRLHMERTGEIVKQKKNFTKLNRTIIKVKHKIGQYGLCLFAPLFLSVPIGSIICAKFYGNQKNTFSIIIFGLAMNSFGLTVLFYNIL